MIRNLIVNINSDRSVFPKELKVANRYEIKTNVLNIKFSFDLPENSFVYLVLTRNQIQYYYPLINNSFSFGSNETWINGGWIGYVLISKAEIIDGVVNSSEALFISDAFGLTVGDSEFNIEKLEQQELPAQLHLLYDDLLHLKAELEELIRNGDFSDLAITIDSALSKTSENPVQNKVITEEIDKLKESIDDLKENGTGSGGESVIVDSELSTTSENPVQNKAITEEINNLKESISILGKIVKSIQESLKTWGNIIVSESVLSIDEGSSATFTVTLDEKPDENQTVNLTTSGDFITVSPTTLTFTPNNYNVPQTVTVQSEDDNEEGIKQSIITLSSVDKTVQISVEVIDNEVSIEWHTITLEEASGMVTSNYLLSKYNGSESDVLVPSTLNGKSVQMNVQANAGFDGNKVIKNLKFEEGITGIFRQSKGYLPLVERILDIPNLNAFSFAGSETLKMVSIQKNNTNCKSFDVNGSTMLKEVSGLNNLLSIESMDQSFKGVTSLISIDAFPPNLKSSKLMFWQCTSLTEVPVIDKELTTWDQMFLECTSLKEVTVSAMTGCGVNLIGYSASTGTGWTGGNFTFKCNYGSDMYTSFRNMICDSRGSSENLFIETLDSADYPITNVVMWGDSMTRAGNNTMGNMPDQLATLVTNDVMIWNYGISGNTIQSAGTRFDNHPEKHGDVSVIWLGTNNSSLSGNAMTDLIQSTFIDKLTTDKYIVVGLLTTNYSDEKNQAFANAFGEHFLNIREYFLENMWSVSGLTATEQDNTDLSNGLIPTSFRVDQTHLNPDGGKVVATAIKEKLLSMGYITSGQVAS